MRLSVTFALITTLFFNFFAFTAQAGQPLDTMVATVDTEVITRKELDERMQSWKRQFAAEGRSVPDNTLAKQTLDSLIDERLQLLAAERFGIEVDDQDLNQAIASIAKQNDMDNESFRKALAGEGIAYEKFREQVRKEMILGRVQQNLVTNQIIISDEEVAEFLENSSHLITTNQEYHVGHILLSLPENPSSEELQNAQNQAESILLKINEDGASFSEMATKYSDSGSALKGGDLGWYKAGELPTLFSTVLPQMKVGEVRGPLRNTSGIHLVKLIDVRSGEIPKQEVEQTRARHILIKSNEIVSDDEAQLRANELRQRIISGESFAELARTHSEDPGTASKGGDLGWVDVNSNLDPDFLRTMQNTPTGEISPPAKSAFGWHIIQVEERRQKDQTKQYHELAAKKMLQNSKFLEARQSWINELRDASHIVIKDEDLKEDEE